VKGVLAKLTQLESTLMQCLKSKDLIQLNAALETAEELDYVCSMSLRLFFPFLL
jgi:hypothetical protein